MRYIKKPKPITELPVILYDKQEKRPWIFLQQYGYKMERVHLKVGDYTLKGFESKVSIEKKSGLAELLIDLTAKYRETFKRFLTKLSEVPICAIVVEDDLSRVATVIKTLQQKSNGKLQLTETTVYYWVAKITLDYKIPVIFTGRDWRVQGHIIKHLITEAHKQCIS